MVGGAGLILSRIFGFPDVVVAFVNGMLSTSMAYWANNVMAKRWNPRTVKIMSVVSATLGLVTAYVALPLLTSYWILTI